MNQRLWIFLLASGLGAAVALGACGGDSLPSDTSTATSTGAGDTTATTTTTAATTSSTSGGMGGAGTTGASASATGTGGAGGGAPDCYSNPMTHVEIINACTTADKVDKMSTLPLLGPNGELPPLP